ncbi:CAP domain-containing protein [Salimicrobium flavidum]|uniref:Uncharacterized conserved protein YkwD, contains CAP (CSP/antigen 5/PR1) domain n=1 Tax=Salimicrobium flavidum TaxID=570947 RepID=A0A1N7IZU8_9BACI|nr:CAP domain-containing protein [Salimicrobium flavidum]SIS42491.1 Uncharacterized conserved protein YkwD, contains CAP (CSP/antigen 5/PR1) domain [Salimicrobium flavidum]
MKKLLTLILLVGAIAWTGATLSEEWDTIKEEIDTFLQEIEDWETGGNLETQGETPSVTTEAPTEPDTTNQSSGGEMVRTVYGTDWELAGVNSGDLTFNNGNGTGEYLWKEGKSYDGITVGDPSSTVTETWGEPEGAVRRGMTSVRFPAEHYEIYERNDKEVTVFYDRHEGDVIKSLYIVPISTASGMTGYYAEAEDWSDADQSRIMLGLINKDRTSRGLDPLTWKKELVPVAEAHSEDMNARNYFSHTNPDGEGPADRARSAGVSYSMIGENLAYGQNNAVYAHEGLMDSKGHRENILNPAYEEVGIGVDVDEKGAPYFTVLFYKE